MSLKDYKVDTAVDYNGRDIASLPDVPNISSTQLKARFDSLVKDLLVPKYNGLIDGLGEPAHLVFDGIDGNLVCLGEGGDLCDSGFSHEDIEYKRGRGVITAGNMEAWYKIAAFHIPTSVASGRSIRLEGYSGVSNLVGRGHWELIVTVTNQGDSYCRSCRLVLADYGITAANFDFRQLDSGEYALWFKPEVDTDYTVFSQLNGELEPDWVELFNDDTSGVTGIEIKVEYGGSSGMRLEKCRVLVTGSSEYTDIDMPGASVGGPVITMCNNADPRVLPKCALCETAGQIRVYWETVPSGSVSAELSVLFGI